jgi:di/tricarboxylate transporter
MDPAIAVSWHMWATFAVIFGAIVLYASDRYSVELISIGTVCALVLLFHIAPLRDPQSEIALTVETLLSGFANPALAAVMGLIIIGQGVTQSGAMDRPTKLLLSVYERRPAAVIGGFFLLVMATSAFLNDTPVVVMFLPIAAAIAAKGGVLASQLMMPLSFVALFGGMTTVIGSSTNILAAGVYRASTGEVIGFFDLTPMALVIGAVGLVYLATAGRLLLPRRTSEIQRSRSEGKQFIAQFTIELGNSLIGTGAQAGLFPSLPNVTVRLVQRGGKAILPPFENFSFQAGDVVVIAVTREALTTLLKNRREILSGLAAEFEPGDENARTGGGQLHLAEAIVAPASRMIGRTIAQTGFTLQTGCLILGVERRSRMVRAEMNTLRLESGDVLLILGSLDNMRALRFDRDLIVLEWSMTGIPGERHALAAALIFASVVLSAASGLLPIPIAALTGVLAMLAAGCLNIRQAARSFDRRIYLLIGASLAMGTALEATGGASFLGGAIARASENYGAATLLSAMFILSAMLTNVLSNNATAVLLTPVAVSAAQHAGLDPLPFALTVIYGANCPFATPIAYQTNLLVMTPGHYKFRDFLIVGGPLIILLWIVYSLIAPFYFGLN